MFRPEINRFVDLTPWAEERKVPLSTLGSATKQRKPAGTTNPWDAFERIYCISLAQRPDRLESAKSQFGRVGLTGKVEFIIVDKHPTDSERGIFESHIACLRAGLAAGADKILVFEDDIVFTRFSPERLKRAAAFMQSEPNWRLFFFGCFVNSSRKTAHPSIVKIDYRCLAHGYVIHRDFAQKLVQAPYHGVSYDDHLRSTGNEGIYALYPAFAFQSAASTDNDSMRHVDRRRRLAGGLKMLQHWNEFSTRRLMPIIAAHALLLAAIILLLLRHHLPWR
jgi:GR25 family glycosyltransferase involved in LPS biosynthesis